MKKIVALVLSLVMALSLCTVAFGASYTLRGLTTDSKNNVVADVTDLTSDVKFVAEKNYNNGTGYVEHYALTAAFAGYSEKTVLLPCDQDEAQYAVYKNKTFVSWVKVVDGVSGDVEDQNFMNNAGYVKVLKTQSETSAKASCTVDHFKTDGYVDDNGNFYIKDAAGFNAKVNGKIVKVVLTADPSDVIYASHIFGKVTKNDKTGFDEVECLICGGKFACTNDEAVATKNGYKISAGFEYDDEAAAEVYNENKYEGKYDFAWGQEYADSYKFVFQLKAGTDTKTDTKPGVDSAKTFDAGIAMYVGMSLLSVAGSAVVIGKKKEF